MPISKQNREVLQTYLDDMYKLINKNLAEYMMSTPDYSEKLQPKIEALTKELFKVKRLINELK
jgi:hypothetical protein